MTTQEERDRAAEARVGGRMLVKWPHARVWALDTLELSAKIVAAGAYRRPTLHESDWPIYRAALTQSTEDCQSNGHRDPLHAETVIERYQRESR